MVVEKGLEGKGVLDGGKRRLKKRRGEGVTGRGITATVRTNGM